MITKLTESELLNYLMTSEFNEGLTPDQFKFLLFKFRNFYRISSGKYENSKVEIEGKKREVENIKTITSQEIDKYKSEKIEAEKLLDDTLQDFYLRKLSFNERWNGKIKLKENEIRRLQKAGRIN